MDPALQMVYAAEPIPATFSAAVYLAGPSSTTPGSWRRQAVDLLEAAGYRGVVYVPEPHDLRDGPQGRRHKTADRQGWAAAAQHHADAILFFVPTDHDGDPLAYEEWGRWQRSGKLVFGAPSAAAGKGRRWAAPRLPVPTAYSLAEAVHLCLPLLQPGVSRSSGERAVPLFLWRSPAFQRWYRAQIAVGNHLEDIEVEWTYRPRSGVGRAPLVYVLRPRVWVRAERRYKSGEVIVGRSDVSATVLYQPPAGEPAQAGPGGLAAHLDTLVAVVREFRSAVRNREGMVWSLPGGSAEDAAERESDPLVTAAREVEEETGLLIAPADLQQVSMGARQVAATILSHRTHLYRARLTAGQVEQLRDGERRNVCYGANPGERCYVAVKTVREILSGEIMDWAQIGMLLCALG